MCVCVCGLCVWFDSRIGGGAYSALQTRTAVVSLDTGWESHGGGGMEALPRVSHVRAHPDKWFVSSGEGFGGGVCCGFAVWINVRHEVSACCSQGLGGEVN